MFVLALGVVVFGTGTSGAAVMGTAFTYQGRLMDANEAADGLYDFMFKLYDVPTDGNQVGIGVNTPDVDVIDGYFTVLLDFNDPCVFNGQAKWLEIGVRPGEQDDPNTYTVLTPRQEITPTPYALNSAGLILPYSGTASIDNGLVFSISNTGMGAAIKGTGQNGYGVQGESAAAGSSGVFGINNTAGGYGVFGWSDSGTGVKGFTSGTGVAGLFQIVSLGNSNAALEGRTNSIGTGVYGWATAGGGTNYGVRGRTESAAGYAGYFEGRVYSSGSVGIGTETPNYKLEVEAPTNQALKLSTESANSNVDIQAEPTGSGSMRLNVFGGANAITFNVNSVEKVRMNSNGDVGIGTAGPGAKLEVNGQVKITGGSPGAGKVLTSDAAGLASWQTPSAGADSDWMVSGADMYSLPGGSVGIGTTTPVAKLEVAGDVKVSGSSSGGAVSATNSGASGYGVYGAATAGGDVTNYGGYFETPGKFGAGVYGLATNSYGGKGVWGEATGDAGIGVYGETPGNINPAIMGVSTNATGGKAVLGTAAGASGIGVYGAATASSGTNYGVYGTTNSPDGYAGYFSGNVKIAGSGSGLVFPDGTKQTTALPEQHVYFSVKRDASYAFPGSTITQIDFSSNSTVWENEGGGFHQASSMFIAPVSGIYTFHGCLNFDDLNTGDLIYAQFRVNSRYYNGPFRHVNGTTESVEVNITVHLDAGDGIQLWGYVSSMTASLYGNSTDYAFTYFNGARVF